MQFYKAKTGNFIIFRSRSQTSVGESSSMMLYCARTAKKVVVLMDEVPIFCSYKHSSRPPSTTAIAQPPSNLLPVLPPSPPAPPSQHTSQGVQTSLFAVSSPRNCTEKFLGSPGSRNVSAHRVRPVQHNTITELHQGRDYCYTYYSPLSLSL